MSPFGDPPPHLEVTSFMDAPLVICLELILCRDADPKVHSLPTNLLAHSLGKILGKTNIWAGHVGHFLKVVFMSAWALGKEILLKIIAVFTRPYHTLKIGFAHL